MKNSLRKRTADPRTPAGVNAKFGVIADDMVWLAKRWNLFPQPAKGHIGRATPPCLNARANKDLMCNHSAAANSATTLVFGNGGQRRGVAGRNR